MPAFRRSIVGRANIVGRRGYADELEAYGTGAVAPPPPPPAAPMPPGHPHAHPGHPAHPHHPHHARYHAWYHGGGPGPEPYGMQYHPRGVPVAYARAPLGPVVHDEQPTHTREFPIGFSAIGVNAIPATTQSEIDQRPQVLFRGERLAVPSSIVGSFDFNDIKVGKDSQLAAAGIMPTECFSNLSVGVRMQLDTAEPGILVSLFVTNNALQSQEYRSVLYGTVIE